MQPIKKTNAKIINPLQGKRNNNLRVFFGTSYSCPSRNKFKLGSKNCFEVICDSVRND